MSCWAVIPVKPPPERKSRLSAALAPAERDALVLRMAEHVAQAASHARGIDHVAFIAPSSAGLPEGFRVLHDDGTGLNAAATTALSQLAEATRIVIIAGDLPLLTSSELEPLAVSEGFAIATDRHGTGTNVIALPLPDAAAFAFAFGPDSYALHRAEAERLGLALTEVRGNGLARDVDEPADLADAAALLGALS
jgi:2-phospho-L-lactate guanylyltransferase